MESQTIKSPETKNQNPEHRTKIPLKSFKLYLKSLLKIPKFKALNRRYEQINLIYIQKEAWREKRGPYREVKRGFE
jgi:hypothetical protein